MGLTPQEIIEGNKLIASFMGDTKRNLELDPNVSGYHYHNSFDWLMPVVNKIRSLYNATVDVPFDIVDVIAEGCIEANIIQVYTGVVEFIKWYNQNKEK